jgi:hypothetical protein
MSLFTPSFCYQDLLLFTLKEWPILQLFLSNWCEDYQLFNSPLFLNDNERIESKTSLCSNFHNYLKSLSKFIRNLYGYKQNSTELNDKLQS